MRFRVRLQCANHGRSAELDRAPEPDVRGRAHSFRKLEVSHRACRAKLLAAPGRPMVALIPPCWHRGRSCRHLGENGLDALMRLFRHVEVIVPGAVDADIRLVRSRQ